MDIFRKADIFKDRSEAGLRLAEQLLRHRDENPVVLALPRGGVPVGAEISRKLGAPLDVVVARKIGAPDQPELAIGAVAEGIKLVNERVVRALDISEVWIDRAAEKELEAVEQRTRLFRGDRPAEKIEDRTAILVDDGIATGMTAKAAIRAVRRENPRRIVLAAPVCAEQTARELAKEVDEVSCLKTPEDLWAIGLWYKDFHQTPDEEVINLLEKPDEN